jgi:hypothetical protein
MATHVQLCFVLDCTGSMQDWIDAARDQIRTILDQTQQDVETGLVFEVGFVGYRDFGDAEQIISIPFTRDIDDLRRRIQAIRADGGNDVAEDVVGGLMHAVEMMRGRTTGVRQVIHIADAPAHGKLFHDVRCSDRYPNGDPNGQDPCHFIHELSTMGVDYTFVRIHRSTDTMLEAFHNSYSSSSGTFKVLDLVPQGRIPPRDALFEPISFPRHGRRYSDASSQTADFSPAISRHLVHTISRYTASQDPEEV